MIIKIIIWITAFILPSLSFGGPVPNSLYLVVPSLAAVDGLMYGGIRRILFWVGLSVLYEIIYQMPVGVFALTIIVVSSVHIGISKVFRIDMYEKTGQWNSFNLLRSLGVAYLWMICMIVVSSVFNFLIASSHAPAWNALFSVWISSRAAFWASGIIAIILGVLYLGRTSRTKLFFPNDAIIQKTNLSD